MKRTLTLLYLLTTTLTFAQNDINWDGKYQIQLSDFQSPSTQIGGTNMYSLHISSGIDFAFFMNGAQFLFTKNFNSKVSTVFKRNSASLVAQDTLTAQNLVNFARYDFDLSELYARKFRKSIFEKKQTLSGTDFFKPLHDEMQKEFVQRETLAGKETDLGRNAEKLKALHEQVLKEIEELADFCKECKSPKKKK